MRFAPVRHPLLSPDEDTASREQFLTALIETSGSREASKLASCLLDRYKSIEGIFFAMVDSLDEAIHGRLHRKAVAKPDLGRLLVSLAKADDAQPDINDALYAYLAQTLGRRKDEALFAVFLNRVSDCIDTQIVAYGDGCEVSVGLRRLLRTAIRCGASAIILAHNHPSGSLAPSELDYASTAAAERAATTVGIALIDHLIVAGESVFSIRSSRQVRGN